MKNFIFLVENEIFKKLNFNSICIFFFILNYEILNCREKMVKKILNKIFYNL